MGSYEKVVMLRTWWRGLHVARWRGVVAADDG